MRQCEDIIIGVAGYKLRPAIVEQFPGSECYSLKLKIAKWLGCGWGCGASPHLEDYSEAEGLTG